MKIILELNQLGIDNLETIKAALGVQTAEAVRDALSLLLVLCRDDPEVFEEFVQNLRDRMR